MCEMLNDAPGLPDVDFLLQAYLRCQRRLHMSSRSRHLHPS